VGKILGLNVSHDTSVAVLDDTGQIVFALEEERLNRVKSGGNFPSKGLSYLRDETSYLEEVDRVIVGSTDSMTKNLASAIYLDHFKSKSSIYDDVEYFFKKSRHAGTLLPTKLQTLSGSQLIKKLLQEEFNLPSKIEFVKHHNGHLGCGLGLTRSTSPTLVLSLDNQGDGESAALTIVENRKPTKRLQLAGSGDSLGELYSVATDFYGYTKNRHEGKIMGLAAHGSYTGAIDLLLSHISIENGFISLKYIKAQRLALVNHILKNNFRFPSKLKSSIREIVVAAASETKFYPDLAYAIQFVIEERISQLVQYWIRKESCENVILTGGVFSNVKVNQKISEIKGVETVSVFPHMGDGGLSIGGVWWNLAMESKLNTSDPLLNSAYLGHVRDIEPSTASKQKITKGLIVQNLEDSDLASKVAEIIFTGGVVGIHRGSIEFGPRALGNRSILADARNIEMVRELNKRCGRTEFMPFAPVILEEFFDEFMETSNKSLQPFYFMTMTCNVRKEVRHLIPAVTHVDVTARPQIVTSTSNKFLYEVVRSFYELSKVPVLINTSFNIHEEPINGNFNDSVKCLRQGVVDYLVGEGVMYSLKD